MADPELLQLTTYPYADTPLEVNGYEIPDQAALRSPVFTEEFDLGRRMGILYVGVTAERSVAVMPVAGNTQPFGLMHGGAYCVLGESLGSLSANAHGGQDMIALGIDLNATHTGSATSGFVTGVCTAIHLGRTMTVHEIVISDARDKRCSTLRITNLLRPRR